MYRKILVPLDGSKRAERILPHVEELALCLHAEVILLQVFEPPFKVMDTKGIPSALGLEVIQSKLKSVETYLKAVRGELREKGIETNTFVESDAVVNAILEVAKRENVDLIAMASHGYSGLSRVYYGSVAAGVLHKTDRPLLIIRAEN